MASKRKSTPQKFSTNSGNKSLSKSTTQELVLNSPSQTTTYKRALNKRTKMDDQIKHGSSTAVSNDSNDQQTESETESSSEGDSLFRQR